MAKKFVRGITDVKTINKQDFDTNNINDLLSDGQYNYIHRKKGGNEEYHNLTDNIKTISSDNTELLSVTNNNKTTNTATLHPKHDAQKEQLLESTRNTVTINHGTNGTDEKTTVDTNPKKVLEHENLKTGDGLTTSFNTDETTIMFKATKKPPETNLNTLGEGVIRGNGFSIDQVPSGNQDHSAAYVTINTSDNIKVQFYIRESGAQHGKIKLYYRFIINGEVTEWEQMVGDSGELDNLLAQKEQVLESQNNTITINHGTNGTDEKTTVDTNPKKVLEHENLKTGDGLTTSFNTDETTIMFKATKKPPETNLNTLGEGVIRGNGFSIDQVPSGNQDHSAAYVTINTSDSDKVQFYIRESGLGDAKIRLYYRFIKDAEVSEWKQLVGDLVELNNQLEQKQNKLTAGDGISITGDSIYLTSLNDYSEDLNNLTYTCTAKPIDNTPNLPTGVGGNGVLSVIRVGNVVSQTYHALDNNVYYRITNNSSSTFVWTPWVKLTTTAL